MLEQHRRELIVVAARALDKVQMIRFCERTGTLSATDLGRTASHYYVKYDTVEVSQLILTCGCLQFCVAVICSSVAMFSILSVFVNGVLCGYFMLQVFNEMFMQVMTEDRVFELVSKAQEFDQLKVSSDSIVHEIFYLRLECPLSS